MQFRRRMKWEQLPLLLWAILPAYGTVRIRPADALICTYYWYGPSTLFEASLAQSAPSSTPDSRGKNEKAQDVSSKLVAQSADREKQFQWKPAFAQYYLEISIQHAWRFAHEAGTRDATAYGPWFHDWFASIGETRGWDDGDGWHASYVGHPLNGGIYGFIAQQK